MMSEHGGWRQMKYTTGEAYLENLGQDLQTVNDLDGISSHGTRFYF